MSSTKYYHYDANGKYVIEKVNEDVNYVNDNVNDVDNVVGTWYMSIMETDRRSNPHGKFSKGDCTVMLYMGTNCGLYWDIQCCKNVKTCSCKVFKKIRGHTNEYVPEDPIKYLYALYHEGYTMNDTP